MIYAIDTNIVFDILKDDPVFAQSSIDFLCSLSPLDSLIACDVVWAEAAAGFADKMEFRRSMARIGIAYSPMPETAAIRAGEIWKAARTASSKAKSSSRLAVVPDFLIGAHAQECADALITRDRGFMRRWFSELEIVDPSESAF